MPNPWIIIGFLLTLAAATTTAYFKGDAAGEKRTTDAYELSIADLKLEAAGVLLAAEQKARDAESKRQALNTQLELEHVTNEDEIRALSDDNRRLVERIGLWDRTTRDWNSRGNGVPGDADAAGGGSEDPTGVRLSAAASDFLLALTRDADLAAEYGRACHAWALSLGN